MQIILYIIFTILGLLIGSFLNVCIDRLPNKKSIVLPPSRCDSCGRRLTAPDLIPIFSYLRSRGKCRYCGAPIPQRVLWVEITTGALFALLFWKFGLTGDYAITVFYTCVFLVLFVIDLEHQLILNVIVYPMMAVALVISFIHPFTADATNYIHLTNSTTVNSGLNSLIAGAGAFILFFIIVIVSRGGMGGGDINMAGLIGLIVGYPQVFTAIMIAIITGGLVAIFLLVTKIKKRKEGIPFGPFLAVGAVVALLYGKVILDWYLRTIL